MGIFKLPTGLCDDLMQLTRNFWWGDDLNDRKVHWVAWEKLTVPKGYGGLGFRDLKAFNQALLARQAWRLLKFPECLCARVLKARYYPEGHLHDTAFSAGGSQSWQGILYGLELVKKGIIWRIGSGVDVDVWRDNWLPRDNALKITSMQSFTRCRRVCDLMLPGERSWNVNFIKEKFWPYDADEILKLKLPANPREDFLAWHYNNNGLFTVKSTYILAISERLRAQSKGESSTTSNGERNVWKVVWEAKVPQKIRIFGWKLAREALATQANRQQRTLSPIGTCSICGYGIENGFHAVVECTKARALRYSLRTYWELPPEECFKYTGPEWFLNLLLRVDKGMRTRLLFLFWKAWHLRNDLVFGDGKATIRSSVCFLCSYLESSGHLQHYLNKGNDNSGGIHDQLAPDSSSFHWSPPPQGWAKLNSGASFKLETGEATAGCIIRNCRGEVLISAWSRLPNCSNAEEAEILACEKGVQIAKAWINMPIIIEGDCASLTTGLCKPGRDTSRFGILLQEVKNLVSVFSDAQFSLVRREGNQVAHQLAKLAKDNAEEMILILDAPFQIVELLKEDCKPPLFY